MVKLHCFTVEIIQDRAPVPEHEDPKANDDDKSITSYVEIKEDKKFAIRLTVNDQFRFEEYDALSVSLSIDGEYIGGVIYTDENLSESTVSKELISKVTYNFRDRTVNRIFRFEETEKRGLKENETKVGVIEQHKEQGCICVELCHVSGMDASGSEKEYDTNDDTWSPKPIPKDVVKDKGSSSRASYTERKQKDRAQTFDIYDKEEPTATFHLKYRTREVLKDIGIIKSQITSMNDPSEIVIVSDDQETTVQELQQRLVQAEQKLAETRARIKRDKGMEYEAEREVRRKRLRTEEDGDVVLLNERPAHRRGPTAEDDVILLDD